jgi:hypothetical protein
MECLPNDEVGIDDLVKQLCTVKPVLIVLEASGGIGRALVHALVAAESPLPIHVKFEILLKLRESWLRPMFSMPTFWRALLKPCALRCGPCLMKRLWNCVRWSVATQRKKFIAEAQPEEGK